ncbi:MAG: MmgE/PrpD family protein [Nitrosomonas sp.]
MGTPTVKLTETLAAFAAETSGVAIPPDVRGRALALIIDFCASIVRAAQDSESTPVILAMVERLGLSSANSCTVFGLNRRYGAAAAALLNGALGHSLDFDDTHAKSSLHPSAPVVPAAFAIGELVGSKGEDVIAAVIVGFEVCCRVGNALEPTAHYARGFHPTATAGIFGATASAGRLLGLDAAAMQAAFGVAASQASGSLQFLENGAWNKRYQVGEAAMKGVMAAMLAAEGFIGAAAALEGKHGFLKGYSDEPLPDRAIANLGIAWETMKIGLKPYPTCRYTHAAVDGLLTLRSAHDWQPDDVTRISVGLHRNGIALVGDPIEVKRRPRSVVDGQFSMPFAAAVALLRGRFTWDDYDLLGAETADVIADRVSVRHEPALEGRDHPFGAVLEVEARGRLHAMEIADPSGEPDTFPSAEVRASKFDLLTRPIINEQSSKLFSRLSAMPLAASLKEYFA